jgi:hypothetical protein
MSYVPVKRGSPAAFWQHGAYPGCGFGAYEDVGDWTWEFDPYVFSFLAPADSAPQPAPVISGFGQAIAPTGYRSVNFNRNTNTLSVNRACPTGYFLRNGMCRPMPNLQINAPPQSPAGVSGLGGCGCGGKCGGCGSHGMGQAGVFGTGLFASTDISQWGIGEWATVGLGVYVAGSLFGDISSGVKSARSGRKKK